MAVDFDRLWDDRLAPVLESVRRERQQLVQRRTRFSCLGLVSGAVIALLIALTVREWHVAVAASIGAAIGYTFGWLYANGPLRELGATLKARANTVTAEAFGLGYSAKVRRPPGYRRFQELALIPSGMFRGDVEDWFVGAGESGEFEFFELRLYAERRGVQVTRFHGLLVWLPLARRIEGTTVITLDQGEVGNALEAVWHRTWGDSLKRVRLVDQEFESMFEVYGNDQVAARYMLTPSVIEGVKRVERQFRRERIRLALDAESGESGGVLVAVESGGLFDPEDAELGLFDKEHHRKVHAEIESILGLVDLFQRELDPMSALARDGSETA